MKRFLAVLLAALLLSACLNGCANKTAETGTTRIGTLKGSTGMGMVMLMDESMKQYEITLAAAPDEITAAFISGQIDVASVPINLASVLYNKLEGDAVMLAVNTLGVLYVLENGETVQSMADLAGKTVYATGQGATPEYILDYLLEKNGVAEQTTVEFMGDHSELAAQLAADKLTLGMLPEPNVTATLAQNDKLRIALDLTEEWTKVCETPLVQGCLIARRSYVEGNPATVKKLLEDYAASVGFVNAKHEKAALLIESHGIVAKAALAEKAISRCNIVCYTDGQMKEAAAGMLSILFEANPKSVGGALPGEDFYYAQ